MKTLASILTVVLTLSAAFAWTVVGAALPPPTPQQQTAKAVTARQAAAATAQAKAELSQSMDRVVTQWRVRAARNGWQTYPATMVQPPPAAAAVVPVSQAPVRSEKQGTAPPSTDVKDPSKKGL